MSAFLFTRVPAASDSSDLPASAWFKLIHSLLTKVKSNNRLAHLQHETNDTTPENYVQTPWNQAGGSEPSIGMYLAGSSRGEISRYLG
jgi:hypothetical protein